MKYISFDQVVEAHDLIISEYGGLPGVRDKNALDSAVKMPTMSVFGNELYETVFDKAAAYLYFLSRNHPFLDGYKRTAFTVTDTFLKTNGISIQYDVEEIEEFVIDVAMGKVEIKEISKRLNEISQKSIETEYSPI